MIKKFETKPQTIFAPKGVYYIFEDKLNLDFDKIKFYGPFASVLGYIVHAA